MSATQNAANSTDAYGFVGFDEDGLAIYRTTPTAGGYDIPAAPAAPASRAIRIYRAAVITLLAVIAALGTATGVLLTHHAAAAASTSSSVSSYNDGFSDFKLDDCQQGDATACAWLHSN